MHSTLSLRTKQQAIIMGILGIGTAALGAHTHIKAAEINAKVQKEIIKSQEKIARETLLMEQQKLDYLKSQPIAEPVHVNVDNSSYIKFSIQEPNEFKNFMNNFNNTLEKLIESTVGSENSWQFLFFSLILLGCYIYLIRIVLRMINDKTSLFIKYPYLKIFANYSLYPLYLIFCYTFFVSIYLMYIQLIVIPQANMNMELLSLINQSNELHCNKFNYLNDQIISLQNEIRVSSSDISDILDK